MALTDKQRRFVDEYLVDLNATQAAIRAGYSKRRASEIGSQLLRKPAVAEAISAAQVERSKRTLITQDYVLQGIVETVERCRQAVPVYDRSGNPVVVEMPTGELAPVYAFDAKNVLKGFELLGRHLKLFTDKTELTGPNGGPVQSITTTTTDPQEAAKIYQQLMNP
jgi:phage terminase small subunit